MNCNEWPLRVITLKAPALPNLFIHLQGTAHSFHSFTFSYTQSYTFCAIQNLKIHFPPPRNRGSSITQTVSFKQLQLNKKDRQLKNCTIVNRQVRETTETRTQKPVQTSPTSTNIPIYNATDKRVEHNQVKNIPQGIPSISPVSNQTNTEIRGMQFINIQE